MMSVGVTEGFDVMTSVRLTDRCGMDVAEVTKENCISA